MSEMYKKDIILNHIMRSLHERERERLVVGGWKVQLLYVILFLSSADRIQDQTAQQTLNLIQPSVPRSRSRFESRSRSIPDKDFFFISAVLILHYVEHKIVYTYK